MNTNKSYKLLGILALSVAISACDYNDDEDNADNDIEAVEATESYVYEVTLMNITQGQTFSPPALTTHASSVTMWEAGQPASVALERIAEGGDSSEFIVQDGVEHSVTGNDGIGPGESQTLTLTLDSTDSMNISLASMVGITNDGFTGITNLDISSIGLDQTYQQTLMAYDAGTENNDEIEVPAVGGEAFNASREGDVNRVAVHAGVLTELELSSSLLQSEHKFDNPTAKLIITRVQ